MKEGNVLKVINVLFRIEQTILKSFPLARVNKGSVKYFTKVGAYKYKSFILTKNYANYNLTKAVTCKYQKWFDKQLLELESLPFAAAHPEHFTSSMCFSSSSTTKVTQYGLFLILCSGHTLPFRVQNLPSLFS